MPYSDDRPLISLGGSSSDSDGTSLINPISGEERDYGTFESGINLSDDASAPEHETSSPYRRAAVIAIATLSCLAIYATAVTITVSDVQDKVPEGVRIASTIITVLPILLCCMWVQPHVQPNPCVDFSNDELTVNIYF